MSAYGKRWTNACDNKFDASKHLQEIHNHVTMFDDAETPRDLQAMDLFSGEGAFNQTVKEAGMSCVSVDILTDPTDHNILSQHGFYNILNLVLRLVPGLTKDVS